MSDHLSGCCGPAKLRHKIKHCLLTQASLVAQMAKNPSAKQETGFSPWIGKTPPHTHTHPKKEWQPTPVFLPGESHGQGSLAGYSPWGHKKSDMTKQLTLFYSPQYCSNCLPQTLASPRLTVSTGGRWLGQHEVLRSTGAKRPFWTTL